MHKHFSNAAVQRSGRARKKPLPLIDPEPPQLSRFARELEQIELSGIYTNYGPMNEMLEREFIEKVFGEGFCLTVCNATIGLMLAIREAIGEDRAPAHRYALMPSFTFAATAQAALWCGLTPLLCDIDPHTWMMCPRHAERLLQQFDHEIAVVVPYATFGNNLDLEEFRRLHTLYRVPIVVDAAASLGSLDATTQAFGAGFPGAVVFSMHATKSFSVGEGGLIYSADRARIQRLRSMGAFGFTEPHKATSIGLNSKLSEVAALTARLQLHRYVSLLKKQATLTEAYKDALPSAFEFQETKGARQALSFQSVLLPHEVAPLRMEVIQALGTAGIGVGKYFSPHLAEQPYIRERAEFGDLAVTHDIASRVVALPLTAKMTKEDVRRICTVLNATCSQFAASARKGRQSRYALQRSAA